MPDSIKPNYEDLGLDQYGNALGAPAGTIKYKTALDFNIQQEPTPYIHRTAVLNRGGTIQTNLGGLVDFKDSTGGTSLFTYTPSTGAITLNGPIVNNGTITFTAPGTIQNSVLRLTGTSDGVIAIRMFNAGGTERITWGITSTGFGFGTIDEIQFKANTSNKFNEAFGPRAQLADTAGVHAFRVADNNAVEVWRFASDASAVQSVAKSFVLKGTIADPGSQGALTGAIFVGTSGTAGKSTLRVEFPTGVSQQLASEP